jgi:hypothetical protein
MLSNTSSSLREQPDQFHFIAAVPMAKPRETDIEIRATLSMG